MTDILLIGPGESVCELTSELLSDNTTIAFSGGMKWFLDNNLYPDYYCFFDPNTVPMLLNEMIDKQQWVSELKNKSSLIYPNCVDNGDFFKLGFTTRCGEKWLNNVFNVDIFPMFKSQFKSVIPLDTCVNTTLRSTDIHTSLTVFKLPNENMDKFPAFLLPLVLHYFKGVSHIKCIGLGDFDTKRYYPPSSLGYDGYKRFFDMMFDFWKSEIDRCNIKLTVLNENSYFYKLTNTVPTVD